MEKNMFLYKVNILHTDTIFEKENNNFYNTFKNIKVIPKISASKSIILTAEYNDKPVYIKLFEPKQIGLLYEKEIYRYLYNNSILQNTKLNKHFIQSPLSFKVKTKDIKDIIKDIIGNINSEYLYGIVTYDYQGIPLNKLINNIDDKQLIQILIKIFEIIDILNNKLNVYHNDLHFNNIIIKDNTPMIYDYDVSYLIDNENESINPKKTMALVCPMTGSCNRKSQKDTYTILMELLRRNKFIDIIKNHISNENNELWNMMEEIISNKDDYPHWNIYCSWKKDNEKIKPKLPFCFNDVPYIKTLEPKSLIELFKNI